MLHPNRNTPERLRVYDKELGVQEYFSFAKYGEERAWQMARERQALIDYRKRMRQHTRELGINKIFAPDGRVVGLRRVKRERKGRKPYEYLLVLVTISPKSQKKREISLSNRSFEQAYQLAQEAILAFRGVERTPEISRAFAEAKHLYW